VFGSILHETDTETSDIDILIDLAPHFTLFDMAWIALEIEKLTNTTVDVVTPDDISPKYRPKIVAEARPLCRMLGPEPAVLAPRRVTPPGPGVAAETGPMQEGPMQEGPMQEGAPREAPDSSESTGNDPGTDGWIEKSATPRSPPPEPPPPPATPPPPP
jgi:predicted nucleotidyltransferase